MLMASILLIIGEHKLEKSTMNKILKWINPAIEFIMNWMIIFFFPPILTIVVSTNLPSGVDIVKLIIVFFLGLVIFIPFVGFFIHYARIIFGKFKKSIFKSGFMEEEDDKDNEMGVNTNGKEKEKENVLEVVINNDDERTESINVNANHQDSNQQINEDTLDVTEVETISPIQDEFNQLDHHHRDSDGHDDGQNNEKDTTFKEMNDTTTCKIGKTTGKKEAVAGASNEKLQSQVNANHPWKSSLLPSKYCFATYIFIYVVSFIPAAIWDIPQPLHIAATVLSYFISLAVPDRLRVFFHPLLCCAFICYALFWVQALIFGRGVKDEIRLYSNNSKYLLYLNDTSLPFPKATEILFCLLDVTVVAFSFKILEHHKLIIRHIFELVGSIIIMSITSMTVHTALCRLLNIAPLYALSMASRYINISL